jgi:phytoene dehydrogenase-like protein
MSGLLSGYYLRKYNPVLLEQDDRFGGNSKGESWEGIDYSIGAAYIAYPEEGSANELLFKDLGLLKKMKKKPKEDPFVINNKLVENFWEGVSAPKYKYQFKIFNELLSAIYKNRGEAAFPEIPTHDLTMRSYIDQLDVLSIHDYLKDKLGEDLHPHLLTSLEYYCWSTFGAGSLDVSAASGINFLAGDFAQMTTLPGGNAGITEQLWLRLKDSLGLENLRSASTVVKVSVQKNNKVHVCYSDRNGQLKTIEAKAVVMACPKFIVNKILDEIEPERVAAIKRLEYNSYLVANVWITEPCKSDFYDLFLLGSGEQLNLKDIKNNSAENPTTDIILANYATTETTDKTVFTFYRPIPYKGGRMEIFNDNAWEDYKLEFEDIIEEIVCKTLGYSETNIHNIRIARWGHPMPVSKPGLISEGVVDVLQAPFRDRVFFIEQDNWALPSFETCSAEAQYWTEKIKAFL